MNDECWDAKATEVQGLADRHEEKEFYAALKEVYGLTRWDFSLPGCSSGMTLDCRAGGREFEPRSS